MLDENQKETTDVSKAKYIVSDYLSEEQERETGRNNKIKAFDKTANISDKNPFKFSIWSRISVFINFCYSIFFSHFCYLT